MRNTPVRVFACFGAAMLLAAPVFAVTGTLPESSTALLLAGGLAVLAARRRLAGHDAQGATQRFVGQAAGGLRPCGCECLLPVLEQHQALEQRRGYARQAHLGNGAR